MRSARCTKVMLPFGRTIVSAKRTQSASPASPSIVAAALAGLGAGVPRPRSMKGGFAMTWSKLPGLSARRRLQQIAGDHRDPRPPCR